ncbi:c6 zinc finger domain protein [Ophiostoma piceae UAMH 11346]|uniref:C6 zinc finger domain protein n=1 Tax=Ophiostoma piceae (strain UAMH 11346) TaxID=1262450 RepID=S3CBE3_OPHP1|nr:c6 zinc finger domain protein [Ophiostoma piceae UAMH 11346]
MATRSRKGCIDCKQAKIKCDEVHPACGTCARRSRKCRGYPDTTATKAKPLSASAPTLRDALQPLAQMPCAPTPRRGGAVRHSHSHSNSNLYMPYARPSQLPRAMSPPEPLPVASSGSAARAAAAARLDPADPMGSMTSLSGDVPLMGQMGQMPPLGSMQSMSMASMSSMSMSMVSLQQMQSFQNMQSLQNLQHMPMSTMMPFGLSTSAAVVAPADDPVNDMSWAPTNWPEKISVSEPATSASYLANTPYTTDQSYLHGAIYSGIYDTSLTLPEMTVFPGHTLNNDDVIDGEFISPGAAAAHASGASVVSSSTTCFTLIAKHQTHTFPNGRPLVGPDGRRLLNSAAAARSRSPVLEVSGLWSPPLPAPIRGPSFMPLNEILAEDKPFIEMYFIRHPAEMVMSNSFFINEMNGAVLSLLQVSPIVVGESLCAIGENYIKDMDKDTSRTIKHGDGKDNSSPESDTGPSNVVSHRRTKLLSRLRLLNEDGKNPEIVLLLLLALCGAELTNPKSDGKGSNLPSLIDNVAMVLEFHTGAGRELSTTAKYFAKGVARQDLLHSLSRMQRPKIQPSTWLDDYASRHADRLLGLTATLTPILYKLAELAGDVQAILDASQVNTADSTGNINNTDSINSTESPDTSTRTDTNTHNEVPFYEDSLDSLPSLDNSGLFGDIYPDNTTTSSTTNNTTTTTNPEGNPVQDAYCFFPDESSAPDASFYLTQHSDLAEREASIRAQLLMWRPIHDHSLSIQTSRTLLLHASAWRAAALLYLFRLFNRPGSSLDADRTALGMAYEVMMHIHGPAEDVKLSLWPLFVAACELEQPEDRALATALFNEVCHARPIMTARRTKEFVMEHIWPARDRAEVWDWMQLTHGANPNVFMPL